VLAYWVANYEVRDLLLEQLQADSALLFDIFQAGGIEELSNSVNVMANVNFESARIFQLVGSDGTVLAGNVSRIEGAASDGYISVDRLTLSGVPEEEISGYWTIQSSADGYTLLQGTGDHIVAEILEAMAISLLAGFILIMALGTGVGVWVGRLTERRLESISGTLEQVADGNLNTRIPIDETSNDDLTRVSSSINKTLQQLDNLMESQVQITNDIAHDLRTPLQQLRQRLEKMSCAD
jgi:methyl-accepting chemotaxis protein